MKESFELLDVVALLVDLPEFGLRRGEVGTLVEHLAPGVWLVEFSDNSGEEYAMVELHSNQLMKLFYEPGLTSATDKTLVM